MNANTPPAVLRFADLLEPVSTEHPTGPDLEYDPAFVMLQAAVALRTEAQYGDFVDTPQAVNWAEAERDARALLLRTKDIRVVTILTRCRARQSGAIGLRDGLALLKDMLERYGEALHPTPFADGERDPLLLSNALAALADPDAMLADVRDIALPKASGLQLQLRDIERSFMVPRQKDMLAPESATRLLQELWGRCEKAVAALMESQQLVEAINTWSIDALGADAPDLSALARVLQPYARVHLEGGQEGIAPAVETASASFDDSIEPLLSAEIPATPPSDQPALPTSQPMTPSAPARMDRWSALATLQDVRTWFERNEPSSPVIVLLRQSERMVGKRFSELAHIIPAELLAKWDEVDG